MYYIEVLVSSQRYHGQEPLTYAHENQLDSGVIVEVPMGQRSALGVVLRQVDKPKFETKTISKVLVDKPIPKQLIDLHEWLRTYYPAPLGSITQLLLPSSLSTNRRRKLNDKSDNKAIKLPPLTTEQKTAIDTLHKGSGSFLLHGETGSGKTRVYIESVRDTLANGKSAIILTPEIGLTPQLTADFEAVFPGQVTVVHSTQTPAERRDNWLAIHNQANPQIIIGPRSAIFSPASNVGLVVIDEVHDAAYKQEQMPFYQTSRVAGQLAHLHGAKLVLGSATPLVQDYYAFEAKQLPILRMKSAAAGKSKVDIKVVDLKDRQQFSKSPWLSDQLISAIQVSLKDGYQSLVFLNRRGTARVVLCQNCGWQAVCQRCDIPLTYHGDQHILQCHTCGLTDKAPVSCPECKRPDIKFKTIGTKAVVTEVMRLFPEASVARFDSDNSKSESLSENFASLKAGNVDIIVGTQMLSKGLDLPLLGTIGVVLADTGLYFPDFSAEERTFQMLRQVIGRVGRGHIPGTVIVQSYHPESTTVQAAISHDFTQFYETQLQERSLYHFPPYYYVLKITVERAVQASARKAAHDLTEKLTKSGHAIEISGPAPSFTEKARGKFRWQIVVKAKNRSELTTVISELPKNCHYDIDPTNLL